MLSKYRQNHVQPKSPAHIGNFTMTEKQPTTVWKLLLKEEKTK